MEIIGLLINEINDLSMQYSKGLIQYNDYKAKRSLLLDKLENDDSKKIHESSGIFEIVNSFADIIKRN